MAEAVKARAGTPCCPTIRASTMGLRELKKAANERNDQIARGRVVRIGGREIITEGLRLNFWTDFSHRCMTASWPSFIAGAAFVFLAFNAGFGLLYWLGDHWFANQPISNVPGGDYIDYFYFSIETLSTAGYGDMHPQTHYGHFVATIELFTGIFSMSLMTGLIFARFSRPQARLLFAQHPVISNHEGRPTLMIRLANERQNLIGNATAKLWMFKNIVTREGMPFRRFTELPLLRNEMPALALSWTLHHVIDEASPLYGITAEELEAANVSLAVVVTGYDVVAAQSVHARQTYDHPDIRFGHRYADILDASQGDGRIRIDYGRFHDTYEI
jgi:inward rectifier potassium channel